MSWGHYNDYVPAAERRRQMLKKIEKLKKAGEDIQPIEPLQGRGLIAKSFWGKAWCRHLEKFSDYENRLPRGRSYVRNGSVCHLGIEPETAVAMVSGSELYELSIHIDPLDPEKWDAIKSRCRGRIGSLIELLQGKISDEIMEIVTDIDSGLFPHPDEIRFNCNCPDWADMCKHVAAAMYGIGVRLDSAPELLFKLRGVDHAELIAVDTAIDDLTAGSRSRRRRTLRSEEISAVFGVELDDDEPAPGPRARRRQTKNPAASKFEPTGAAVRNLRKASGLTRSDFAKKAGVSPASVIQWEKTNGALNLRAKSFQALETLFSCLPNSRRES